MYNILAKVLTNRLRKVLGKVIDNRQIAFGGRQLLHSVLVENEVVVMQKRKGVRYGLHTFFVC